MAKTKPRSRKGISFFQFDVRRPKQVKQSNLNRITTPTDSETFVGTIQGMKSSDLEERFARALDKRRIPYEFRNAYFAPRGMFGQVELDFMIKEGGLSIPVQVDGSFAHRSEQQHRHDDQQDALLNEYLSKQGGTLPIKRVLGIYLGSQAEADQVVKDIL